MRVQVDFTTEFHEKFKKLTQKYGTSMSSVMRECAHAWVTGTEIQELEESSSPDSDSDADSDS